MTPETDGPVRFGSKDSIIKFSSLKFRPGQTYRKSRRLRETGRLIGKGKDVVVKRGGLGGETG